MPTKEVVTVHQVRVKIGKEMTIIPPKTIFNCPEEALAKLLEAGAIAEVPEPEFTRLEFTPEEEQADAARVALVREAEEIGVKGIRKNSTTEKIQELVDAKKAENEAAAGKKTAASVV